MIRHPTRRAALAAIGSAGTLALTGCVGGDDDTSRWEPVESPTMKSLYAVTATRDGPYAVGESGRIVARCHLGWATVSKHGPGNGGNALFDADGTDDGRAMWAAGDSGAVGRYDVVTRTSTDFSAPLGKTSSWEAVGVLGVAGEEWVFLLNGSGELLRGRYGGDGTVDWDDPFEPGSGTTGTAVAFGDNGFGYVVDSGGEVFKTVDREEWRRIGIDTTSDSLFDVSPFGEERAAAAAQDGRIFRYNGFDWTTIEAGTADLHAIDRTKRGGLAVGESGVIYQLTPDGWQQDSLQASAALHGATLGAGQYPPVAVGDSGEIVERPRPDDP
ncbi:hypothetical protein [Halobaculum limi]|uniref:hypothetical protein n=1 Tax=Halobaculum limi TaxID=3031916 RepID=UPI00240493F3|nr:hypothetical protein [Halobaculum sp. YSMS11]